MGALEDFFRFENAAQALPPSGTHKVEDLYINFGNFPLRLYCLRISETLVVLFNCGKKTADTAQGGKTSMSYLEANIFAKRILDALREKDIYITNDQRAFRYYDDSDEIIIKKTNNMRSQVFQRILDSAPKDVDIFVDWYANLVVRINQLLRENNISKKELAEKMDKKPSEISKWLSGEHNFTLRSLAKLSAELG